MKESHYLRESLMNHKEWLLELILYKVTHHIFSSVMLQSYKKEVLKMNKDLFIFFLFYDTFSDSCTEEYHKLEIELETFKKHCKEYNQNVQKNFYAKLQNK